MWNLRFECVSLGFWGYVVSQSISPFAEVQRWCRIQLAGLKTNGGVFNLARKDAGNGFVYVAGGRLHFAMLLFQCKAMTGAQGAFHNVDCLEQQENSCWIANDVKPWILIKKNKPATSGLLHNNCNFKLFVQSYNWNIFVAVSSDK